MATNEQICECKCTSHETMEDMKRGVADLVLNELRQMKEKKNKKKSRSLYDKFADEVSFLGLAEAIKSKQRAWKILWVIIFLCCVASTIYFLSKIFEEYRTDPTATKVKMTRQTTYPFPPMVLCVDTWLNTKKALNMGFTKEAIHYGLSYLISYTDALSLDKVHRYPISANAKQEFENVYKKYNFSSLSDFYKNISLDAYRSIETGSGITFSCNRCVDEVLPKVIVDQNVCYRINLFEDYGKLREMAEMVIRVPDLNLNLTRGNYWRLYVNPSLTQRIAGTPFLSILQDHTHTVKITSENYLMINHKNEPCIEMNDPKKPNYSSLACSTNCEAGYLKARFNCTVFSLDSVDTNRNLNNYCNTYHVKNWRDSVVNHDSDAAVAFMKCLESCDAECNLWIYATEIDVHVSTELQIETTGRKSKGRNETNINMAKIIFINNDVLAGGIFKFTEVYTYSFETLVGNVGGTCGIWIGASILTFVQLLTFCSKHCAIQTKKRLPAKKKTSKKNKTNEPVFV